MLWTSECENLDEWTMHIFPNPITYIIPYSYVCNINRAQNNRQSQAMYVPTFKQQVYSAIW